MISKTLLPSLMMLMMFNSVLPAQEIEVTVQGIRSSKGEIVIGVFKDEATYMREEAFLSRKFAKDSLVNGVMKIRFTVEPGIYGLTLLDDENSSGLMEYNFLGIPKEGFGFSDYYHSGFTKPKFDAFRFTTEKGQKKNLTVKIRYM
ncbi:MAG TPA: DUF2141 domain-containing protein [Bacteroidales bacterium]|nr:DUF2141 domain-containing protein [Bacteroidales bacterium]